MKTIRSLKILSTFLAFALLVSIGYIIELKNGIALNKTEIIVKETVTAAPIESPAPTASTYKTNINTAGIDELCKLKGIGEATAQRIIDYRNENGGFKSIEDLLYIKGIGEKTLAKFKDSICIE